MKNISCCFFPTTVVFLDDDALFMENISMERDFKEEPCLKFTDPQAAIQHINQDNYVQDFLELKRKYIEKYQYGDDAFINYLPEIIRQIFNSARYQQVSVAVIDYEMPAMNGLDVCKRINNTYVKKILLTGVADEGTVIKAFNEGLIYQYIRKNDRQYIKKLYEAIAQAQRDYFNDICKFIWDSFRFISGYSALSDPVFMQYFHQIIERHKIREYYLVEFYYGTFFMVDEKGQNKCLSTLTSDILDMLIPDEPTSFLGADEYRKLQQRELIFCYNDPFCIAPFDPKLYQDWASHLKKPHLIHGKELYYTYFGDNLIRLPEERICLYKNSIKGLSKDSA